MIRIGSTKGMGGEGRRKTGITRKHVVVKVWRTIYGERKTGLIRKHAQSLVWGKI